MASRRRLRHRRTNGKRDAGPLMAVLPIDAPLPNPLAEGGRPPSGRRAWQSQFPAHPPPRGGEGAFMAVHP